MTEDEDNGRLLLVSESPIEQIWTQLSMWESRALARKLITERAHRRQIDIAAPVIEAKALALSYCLRNARENLRGPRQTLTLQTVANYYGCMWLASAILAADPANDVDLPQLERFTKRGHGLGNFVDSDAEFPDNEFVYVKETGFFPEFLKASGIDPSEITHHKSPTRGHADGQGPTSSTMALFARIPELAEAYTYVTGQWPLSFPVHHASRNMGEDFDDAKRAASPPAFMPKRSRPYVWLELASPLAMPLEHLLAHGPPLTELAVREFAGRKSWEGKLAAEPGDPWYRALKTYKSAMCAQSWIKPLLGRIGDPFSIHLVLLYQLSILARYRPAVWREIIEGDRDQYRVLFAGYDQVVARILPELALRRIDDRHIHITQPGSWTAPT